MIQAELSWDGPSVEPFPVRAASVCMEVFADGGLIGRNPSSIGGTWAWVQVDQYGEKMACASGIVLAEPGGTITNNFTELLAAVEAMEALEPHWHDFSARGGRFYTDSYVTLCRITNGNKFLNIPPGLEDRCRRGRSLLALGKRDRVVLLGGHPTKDELQRGVRKDGLPCSKWNVLCDAMCKKESERHLSEIMGRSE